jgi:RNA polymerase sigma factor (sigma-70 family)
MASGTIPTLLKQFHRLAAPAGDGLTDTQLLQRFVADKDETAFEVLVWRHGPLVYRVCRRLLRHDADVEDAFQATFLVLVRKAAAIRNRAAVAGWLHQVAQRVSQRARAAQRTTEPYPDTDLAAPRGQDALLWRDQRAVLDEEIGRLPAKYRDAVVLFYLSRHTTAEAARQLGCPRGTLLSRLAWARQRLRQRLTQRGLTLSAGALAAWLAKERALAAAPTLLISRAVRAAMAHATGKAAAAGVVSARAATFMEGVLRSMFLTKLRITAAVGLLAIVMVLGVGLWGGRPATAETPARQQEEAARAAPPRTRIALLNLTYVIKHCDEYQALQESVKKQASFFQERVKASHANIDKWRREIATPGLPADKKDWLERDIKAEQRKIQDDQEEARQKVAKLSDQQTIALYKKVKDAASRYARANAIDLVLHYSDASPDDPDYYSPQNVTRKFQVGASLPLYWQPDMDISRAVVRAMNAAYHASSTDSGTLSRGDRR